MAYGIMRVEKRGRPAVYGLQIEANRTKEDHEQGRDFDRSDIDWSRTQNNIQLKHTERWNEEITRQLRSAGIKERKDSIVMLDGVYTASKEWFEQADPKEVAAYFMDCYKFHVQEYCQGDERRVVNAVIHLDETTPHMQIASVPLLEDEKGIHLSAKRVMGNRSDYRLRQDRFFDQVTKSRGMERGEVREPSQVKAHTTKREWQIATQDIRLSEQAQELQKAREDLDAIQQEVKDRRKELLTLGEVEDLDIKKPLIGDNIKLPYDEAVRLIYTAQRVEQADEVLKRADLLTAIAKEQGDKYIKQSKQVLSDAKEQATEIIDNAERRANSVLENAASYQLEQIKKDFPVLEKHFSRSGVYQGKDYDRNDIQPSQDRGRSR